MSSNVKESIVDTKVTTAATNIKKDSPKKRGRKPKIKSENGVVTVIVRETKKRGRKPKLVKAVEREMLQPRRRGRKPKDKFNEEPTDFNEYQNILNQEENVIIKLSLDCLNFQDENMTDNLYQYNPDISEPKPFDEVGNEFATLDTVYDNIDTDADLNAIQDNTIE